MVDLQLLTKFQKLPNEIQSQLLDYTDFLSAKYLPTSETNGKKEDTFSFDWEGGIEDMKDEFTSVELQHHANQLR
mgnify:CR=1 FL=1